MKAFKENGFIFGQNRYLIAQQNHNKNGVDQIGFIGAPLLHSISKHFCSQNKKGKNSISFSALKALNAYDVCALSVIVLTWTFSHNDYRG